MRQILATKTTVYDPGHGSIVTHTKLCYFNNGVCCVYDSKTKSRPTSITILFKLLSHKNNTLDIMNALAVKWEKMPITHVNL